MPLPLPNLDDRRWADLADEGRALIPRYAPNWTDHNVHDPGITLIELFAWLTEMTDYQLNQVPARHRRKFLALIGFNSEPPRAASTVLSFAPDPASVTFELAEGAQFEATDPDRQAVRFRTTRDLTVSVVTLDALQVDDGQGAVRDWTPDWRDGSPVAALGRTSQTNAALYLGFRVLPTQVPLALAFRFQGPGNSADDRDLIRTEAEAQGRACLPVRPDIHCEGEARATQPSDDTVPPHHSAEIVWEVTTGVATNQWLRLEPVDGGARPDVGEVMDDTRSLTLDGIVEVNLPAGIGQMVLGEITTPMFYLRARLAGGVCDAAPILLDVAPNAVFAEQAVPVWQTFPIAAGVPAPATSPAFGVPTGLQLQLDVAGVVQALTFAPAAPSKPNVAVLGYHAPTVTTTGDVMLELILAGIGDGRPGQQLYLPAAPVQTESFQLFIHSDNVWQSWTMRADFDASRRTDFHFLLDATRGQITFGDGERGRPPLVDDQIMVSYRATRAELGNVAARTVTRPAETPRNAGLTSALMGQLSTITTNRAPAGGGSAAETLVHTAGRAAEVLHAHERLLDLANQNGSPTLDQVDRSLVRAMRAPTRGVNLIDLERLALEVPGSRIARARAWAGVHPAYPCLEAPGVVTVVIIPDLPVDRPEPSPGLLAAVQRYLDRRRMICTRLEVVGPEYLEVRVRARVQTRIGADASRVKSAIQSALKEFLDPHVGGPDHLGWPFGRDVHRIEILQLIAAVPGVDHVVELSLSGGLAEPQCGNLSLCPTWLVASGAHHIETGAALAIDGRPQTGYALTPCPAPNPRAPIPVKS
jgi:hypothetical protein